MSQELIAVDITDKEARALLQKVARKISNPRPVMREISGILHDEVEENFEKEGRPKWEPLADATKRARERRHQWPGSVLQESGSLATSITQKHDSASATVGTNKRYGAIHQFGGQAGRDLLVHIPARDYLTPTRKGMDQVKAALIRYLNRG